MSIIAFPGENLQIEISGWDESRQFFVEKSNLEWRGTQKRFVLLKHHVREGSLVFIRLVASNGAGKGYPIAHRADAVEPKNNQGMSRVHLVESQPRRGSFDVPFGVVEHLIDV